VGSYFHCLRNVFVFSASMHKRQHYAYSSS
jgi:hypothetical protein